MAQKSVSDLRVKILDALSDPTRLELLEYLYQGERCVCEILPAFQRSQSTISKHLNIFDLIRMVDLLALRQISELNETGKILEKSLNNTQFTAQLQ